MANDAFYGAVSAKLKAFHKSQMTTEFPKMVLPDANHMLSKLHALPIPIKGVRILSITNFWLYLVNANNAYKTDLPMYVMPSSSHRTIITFHLFTLCD